MGRYLQNYLSPRHFLRRVLFRLLRLRENLTSGETLGNTSWSGVGRGGVYSRRSGNALCLPILNFGAMGSGKYSGLFGASGMQMCWFLPVWFHWSAIFLIFSCFNAYANGSMILADSTIFCFFVHLKLEVSVAFPLSTLVISRFFISSIWIHVDLLRLNLRVRCVYFNFGKNVRYRFNNGENPFVTSVLKVKTHNASRIFDSFYLKMVVFVYVFVNSAFLPLQMPSTRLSRYGALLYFQVYEL